MHVAAPRRWSLWLGWSTRPQSWRFALLIQCVVPEKDTTVVLSDGVRLKLHSRVALHINSDRSQTRRRLITSFVFFFLFASQSRHLMNLRSSVFSQHMFVISSEVIVGRLVIIIDQPEAPPGRSGVRETSWVPPPPWELQVWLVDGWTATAAGSHYNDTNTHLMRQLHLTILPHFV